MNKERLYTVLVEPHITEKATNLGCVQQPVRLQGGSRRHEAGD